MTPIDMVIFLAIMSGYALICIGPALMQNNKDSCRLGIKPILSWRWSVALTILGFILFFAPIIIGIMTK